MDLKTYLESVEKSVINESRVKQVAEIYSAALPYMVQQMISVADTTVFLEGDLRILSVAEILNADQDLNINCSAHQIIPLIDCLDNDFIVYLYRAHTWAKFNIVDEIIFSQSESLSALL